MVVSWWRRPGTCGVAVLGSCRRWLPSRRSARPVPSLLLLLSRRCHNVSEAQGARYRVRRPRRGQEAPGAAGDRQGARRADHDAARGLVFGGGRWRRRPRTFAAFVGGHRAVAAAVGHPHSDRCLERGTVSGGLHASGARGVRRTARSAHRLGCVSVGVGGAGAVPHPGSRGTTARDLDGHLGVAIDRVS